ncbi:hypothetical protein CC2G_010069 [Coprinopsis cinerea AmutBmut pab1-1]|nr:hypothetical protein CC2G_010069 [Coprinopsis cinerea AmutBmut pab1-1]
MVRRLPYIPILGGICIKLGLLARYFKIVAVASLNLPGLNCVPINALDFAPYIAGVFLVPVATMTILIAIAFWIHRSSYRNLHSSLLVVLIRNGMIYVLAILILTIVTAIINYAHGTNFLVSIVQGVLHPLLSTRMILHLREQGHRELQLTARKRATAMESLKFAAPTTLTGSETSAAEVSTMEMSDMTHGVQSPLTTLHNSRVNDFYEHPSS